MSGLVTSFMYLFSTIRRYLSSLFQETFLVKAQPETEIVSRIVLANHLLLS